MSQKICLTYNNHTTNMLQVFENLLTSQALVDVTLACDGRSLKAHKVVLSAGSSFFQNLFVDNPCKHPIVIMKDMRYCDLEAIIHYMYKGKVTATEHELVEILKVANTLRVKGLVDFEIESQNESGVECEQIQQNQSTPLTPAVQSSKKKDMLLLSGKKNRVRPRKRNSDRKDSSHSDIEGVLPKINFKNKSKGTDLVEHSPDASRDTRDDPSYVGPMSHSKMPKLSSDLSTSEGPKDKDSASGDEKEPSKLLQQTLITKKVLSSGRRSTAPIVLPSIRNLVFEESINSSDGGSQALIPVSIPSDSSGFNVECSDSLQDVETLVLPNDPPVSPLADTSHDSDMPFMTYMDQPGLTSTSETSMLLDNSDLVPHDFKSQGDVP